MTAEPKSSVVVIATYGRPDDAVVVVASVLANRGAAFELVVVDQSPDDRTADALAVFADDARFRLVRTEKPGKTRAMNLAVELTDAPLVLFTDDDCEVPIDWVEKMTAAFDDKPRRGVVFCEVVGGPHDPTAGFIPAFSVDREQPRPPLWARWHMGLGAGMAARRETLDGIGGLDELLGPGSRFPSADDGDLSTRASLAGWEVVDTDATAVVHHGFRTWEEGVALTRRDFVAVGGACGKALKCGVWQMVPVSIHTVGWLCILKPIVRAVIDRTRPRGLGRALYFTRGFVDSLRLPVDRTTRRFQIPD